MGDEIDYNINNYSDDDLMTLFSLTDENITQNAIFDVTGYYINKSQSEQNENIRCFTIETEGTQDKGFVDDLPYAKKVSKHLNVPLDIIKINSSKMATD